MSLSKNDVKGIIDDYIDYFERCVEHGEHTVHWNKGCVPTKTDWGLTYSNCPGIGNLCKTNEFADNYQCKGFARFIAYLLTDVKLTEENISTDMNDIGTMWVKITNKSDLENYEFEPGDIIETGNPHGAIVWKVQGETVQFLEVWSSMPYGCQIVWGDYNGGIEGTSTKTHLKDIVLRVFKCPVIDEGTPAPIPVSFPTPDTGGDDSGTTTEPETETVTVSFFNDLAENGGVKFDEKAYTVGNTYGSFPSAGTKTGYVFDKWHTATGGYVETWSDVEENITALYAHWNANQYDLWLYPNYGEDNPAHYKVTYDQPYGTALDDISREGYTFNGWRTERTGDNSSRYETTDIVKLAYPHSLYAHWTANTYDVTLNKNDGTNVYENKEVTFGGKYGNVLAPFTPGGRL